MIPLEPEVRARERSALYRGEPYRHIPFRALSLDPLRHSLRARNEAEGRSLA